MSRAVILGGARTPFVKAGTDFAELDVLDLARAAAAEALARSEVDPGQVDEVVFGNVARPVAYHNLAREPRGAPHRAAAGGKAGRPGGGAPPSPRGGPAVTPEGHFRRDSTLQK